VVSTLRDEHRDVTRRRIVAAAKKVFIKKGYTRATIEDIIKTAGVSRTTLYLHFDSKFALLAAAIHRMTQESNEAARRVAQVLIDGDRDQLREWVVWALAWYGRNRPMALAAQEAELNEDKPAELLRNYLDCVEPWVQTWPAEQREQARMRFELCRVQMHHYMWGNSPGLFGGASPVELFTEIWWNTLHTSRVALNNDDRAKA
jgi:AcrR family transcriptional regulator